MRKQKYRYKIGVQCPKCGDKIFSMHRHDYKHCSCRKQMVDGGDDYLRYSLTTYNGQRTKIVRKRFPVLKKPTKKQIEMYREYILERVMELQHEKHNNK